MSGFIAREMSGSVAHTTGATLTTRLAAGLPNGSTTHHRSTTQQRHPKKSLPLQRREKMSDKENVFIDLQGRRTQFPLLDTGESFYARFEHTTLRRSARERHASITPDGVRLLFVPRAAERIRISLAVPGGFRFRSARAGPRMGTPAVRLPATGRVPG